MGQFCFSRITICAEDSLPEEFTSEESLAEALQQFYKNENDGGICHVSIGTDLLYSDSIVEFEMSSGRTQNLEFQVELLVDYLKHNKLSIIEFSSSPYVEMETASMYLDEENFKGL